MELNFMEHLPILFVVVPCYNEHEVLPETSKRLTKKLGILIENKVVSEKSRIVFVNDGSKDNTWDLIREYHENNKLISGICLSRNRGHQNALLAGLMESKKYADVIISMDADLQDDIEAIDEMIEKFKQGAEVVYGVRKARKKDTFFKRFTAEGFYKVMKIMGAEVVFNSADYRLMSKRAVEALSEFKEVNLFLRGMVPLVGFKSDLVFFERSERFAGESKYPLSKMLSFAYEGITSFSVAPIRFFRNFGLFLLLLGIPAFITFLVLYFCNIAKGDMLLASILSFVMLNAGLILTCLGIVGDYVGKTYLEAKHRPAYIVSEFLHTED